MVNGIYRYDGTNNPYDKGTLVVDAKETDKGLLLTVKEMDMRFSTYVHLLFGERKKAAISKTKSPHALSIGNSWFVVYPYRMGCPLSFSLEETRDETELFA